MSILLTLGSDVVVVPMQSQRIGWRLGAIGAAATVIASVIAVALVLVTMLDGADTAAVWYVPLAWTALFVLLAVFLVAIFVRRIDIRLVPGFPWIIGVVSAVVALLPWWALASGNTDLGTLLYRGLRIPQGIMQFWDLSLVMLSVDCARWGFDIYVDNNGCMQDASIYAPGMVWLQYVPFNVFSQANVGVLGVLLIVISSLALVWLARQSAGLGQIALLIAAFGAPWLLLLERGNIDAIVIWAVIATVVITRRWSDIRPESSLWPWIIAAALLWLMGTWKYYPFVLGLMLIPALRIRRGWTVLAGFAIASGGFVLATWENFRFSSASNAAMIDDGDIAVLGRAPVVARMIGSGAETSGLVIGDVVLALVVLFAAVCGAGVGIMLRRTHTWTAMLAIAGASLYLVSVFVAGFGWGYKAVFLILGIPLVARLATKRQRLMAATAIGVLLLIAVQSLIMWNTVLATTAGLVAGGYLLGLAGALLIRASWFPRSRVPSARSY